MAEANHSEGCGLRWKPFDVLPAELLCEILLLSAHDDDKGAIAHLQRLGSVCKRCWRLISASPAFWTKLSATALRVVPLKLQKSGNLPLDVDASLLHGGPHLTTFLGLVTPQRHRWRSFRHWGRDPAAIRRAFDATNTILEVVDIYSYGQPVMLDDEVGTTAIRQLTLKGVFFPFRPNTLQHLRTLSVSRSSLSFEDVCSIFQHCADLTALELRWVENET